MGQTIELEKELLPRGVRKEDLDAAIEQIAENASRIDSATQHANVDIRNTIER